MTAEQRTIDALLAEIRAAGPCPEPEGERMQIAVIDRIFHMYDDEARAQLSFAKAQGFGLIIYSLAKDTACAIRQLRADRARLAAEVERLQAIARCYRLAAMEGDSEVGAGLVARDPSFDEEPPDAR